MPEEDGSPPGDPLAGLEIGPTGLGTEPDLTEEAWLAAVGGLAAARSGVPWALGDLLLWGKQFGIPYAEIATRTEHSEGHLKNCASVAHRFPPGERDPAVQWSIYKVLAPLSGRREDELSIWLGRARDEGLSRDELVRAMAGADGPSRRAVDIGGEVCTCPLCGDEHERAA